MLGFVVDGNALVSLKTAKIAEVTSNLPDCPLDLADFLLELKEEKERKVVGDEVEELCHCDTIPKRRTVSHYDLGTMRMQPSYTFVSTSIRCSCLHPKERRG